MILYILIMCIHSLSPVLFLNQLGLRKYLNFSGTNFLNYSKYLTVLLRELTIDN